MLHGLDSVDWESLFHAHGVAGDVPELLRTLSAGFDEGCIDILLETLWHQGTIYPASAAALPFLFEIVRAGSPDQPRNAGPYEPTSAEAAVALICSIATGEGWVQCGIRASSRTRYRDQLAAQGRSLAAEEQMERQTLADVRETVEANIDDLSPYLDAPEGLGEMVQEVFAAYRDS